MQTPRSDRRKLRPEARKVAETLLQLENQAEKGRQSVDSCNAQWNKILLQVTKDDYPCVLASLLQKDREQYMRAKALREGPNEFARYGAYLEFMDAHRELGAARI